MKQQYHLCAIPDCPRPAKEHQLMCWPHWRRVPRVLNKAIFSTHRLGPKADYDKHVADAIAVIQEKERADAGCPPHCCCCGSGEPCCDCGQVQP